MVVLEDADIENALVVLFGVLSQTLVKHVPQSSAVMFMNRLRRSFSLGSLRRQKRSSREKD